MKKINENLYLYKGVKVTRCYKCYYAYVSVNKKSEPTLISVPTQREFKRKFNIFVIENDGLVKGK